MAIMTRMRDNMPVVLFGLLIMFLITIVFEWGMDYLGIRSGPSDIIGRVNGEKITYKEFSELLKTITDNAKAGNGQEPDEATQRQLRDQTWQSLVSERLVKEEVKRLGINVTDQELTDWVYGDNPPEDLRKNFTDSTGRFDRTMYEQVLRNPNQYIQDPRGEDQNFGAKRLHEFEIMLRQRRIQEKLTSIVSSTVRVTEGELRQRFADQNERLEAMYALFDPNTLVKDADVQVTDGDLREYFDQNIDQYKFDATRTLKYTSFLEKPSGADSAARRSEIEDAAVKAKSGTDFLQLIATYAERPDSGSFFRRGELEPSLEDQVFTSAPGTVVGPIEDAQGFHLIKVLDERKSDKEYVHASHILFMMNGPDTNATRAKAQEVARMAKVGKSFADLAREYSNDASNAQTGGDLGWFMRGRMVAQFDKAVFAASPGQIIGPVRTPFGLHVIKVLGRDNRERKLATILLKVTASERTKNDLFDRAKDFAYNARESELTREAHQTGLEVKETQIQEKSGMVPGIGVNESITRWAFSAKVGAVADPFTITNGYMVAMVAEAKDAGVKSFDEVKESLKPLALRKKKLDMAKRMAADARAALTAGDSLATIVRLNPAVVVQSTGSFSLAGSIPGIGRDAVFLGTAGALPAGMISPAVAGTRGAYLIQVVSRTGFDSTAFDSQKELLRSRMLQEKRNRFLSDWLAQLKERADIEDHRDTFFR